MRDACGGRGGGLRWKRIGRMFILRGLGLLAFGLAVLCLYRVLAYSLRPDDEGVRTRLEGFYGEEEGTLDVVFVGSSAVYSFVSPLRLWKETGLTSYLYATPNQTVPMICYILEECRKTQPDAVYVIELRPMLASEEDKDVVAVDLRRLSDNMPYSLTRYRLVRELAPRTEDGLSYMLDLIKYHDNWKNPGGFRLTLGWGRENPMKGWRFADGWEPVEGSDWGNVNARIAATPENEADLRELLDYCREEDIRAVFLTTPFALSRTQAKIYNYVGDIVEEYGYPYWNLCRRLEEMGLDFGTDYADFRHTNTLGAVKCTAYLGRLLQEYERENGQAETAGANAAGAWQACWEQYEPLEEESVRRIREKIENGGEP